MTYASSRRWMALGLLIVVGGFALRNDLGDLLFGVTAGVGLSIEIMALIKLRRACRAR